RFQSGATFARRTHVGSPIERISRLLARGHSATDQPRHFAQSGRIRYLPDLSNAAVDPAFGGPAGRLDAVRSAIPIRRTGSPYRTGEQHDLARCLARLARGQEQDPAMF